MGNWGVYHQKVCKSGNPGCKGCPKPTAPTVPGTQINSVKLAITPGNAGSGLTHTITLNPGGSVSSGTLTHTSNAINLGSGDGTLTISIPGGEIKLTQLSISTNKLTITNDTSRVSVTKNGEKIRLQTPATLSSKTLTIVKDDSGGTTGQDTATISGTGSVELNYSTSGSGEITISGNAINQ